MTGKPKEKIYYGWIIIAVCFVLNLLIFGSRYSFGVFFKPMEAEFGLNRVQTSGVFSIYMLACCVFGILGGWMLDRYGPRKIMVVEGLIIGVSFVLTGMATALWQVFITYSLLLALGTGAVYTIIMATVSRWFERKRGTAIGIAGAGVGLGSIILTPLSAQLVAVFNWRVAYIIIGIVSAVIIMGISNLLKKEPQQIGLLPDGLSQETERSAPKQSSAALPSLTLGQVIKTGSYWFLLFVWICWAFCLHLVLAHFVPHLTDVGLTSIEAAFIMGIMGVAAIAGRLSIGWATDRMNIKLAMVICILLQAIGMLWLIWAKDTWGFCLFVIIFGFGYGGQDPPMWALSGNLFGMRNLGAIVGTLSIGWAIGASTGPAVAGLVFDANKNYTLAFLLAALAMFLGTLFVMLIKLRKPEKD